jgi:hypothetical protein
MGRAKEVHMGSVIRSAGLLVPAFVLAVAGSAGATTIDVKVPGAAPALTFARARDDAQYRLADIWDSADEGWVVSYTAGAGQTKSAGSASKAKTTTHATTGVVKSMNDTALTITRSGKHGGEMTFDMNGSTQRDGSIQIGTPVSVRYKEEGTHHLATAVAAQHAKHQTEAATTSSKK